MKEEVLLDFKEARSHKKCTYEELGDANGKNESPQRGNLIGEKLSKILPKQHKVSHILFKYIFYYYISFHYAIFYDEHRPKNHRCPYKKIGFKKSIINDIKTKFISQENEIKGLLSTINYLSNEITKYKLLLKNINHLTDIFKNNNCIKSYQDVINTSFLLPQTKKEYLSFFNSYE